MIRRLAVVLVLLVFALEFANWWRTRPQQAEAARPRIPGLPDSIVTAPASDPLLTWTPPAGWAVAPERPMRLATYRVGEAAGEQAAECAVFFFGPGQGGSVDDNVDRWAAQFVGAPNPVRRKLLVNGLDVTRVRIDGTFLAPGADMRSRGQFANWSMLGAIANGPAGPVFWKLTGPSVLIATNERVFDAMIHSVAARAPR